VSANVRWLAAIGARVMPEIVAALLAGFEVAGGLMPEAESVGVPIAVLPVLFHLRGGYQAPADGVMDSVAAAELDAYSQRMWVRSVGSVSQGNWRAFLDRAVVSEP